MRLAASRTFCTAGKSSDTRMAMMAITTSSSISVNALRRHHRNGFPDMVPPSWERGEKKRNTRPEMGLFPSLRPGSLPQSREFFFHDLGSLDMKEKTSCQAKFADIL